MAATKLHRTVNISVALSRQRGWQGAGSQGSQGHLRGSRRRRRAPPRRPRRGSARRASAAASSAARAPRTAQAPCWHAARRGAVKARPSGRQPPAPARSRSRGGTITFPRRDHYVPEAGPWRDRYTYPSSNPGGGGGARPQGVVDQANHREAIVARLAQDLRPLSGLWCHAAALPSRRVDLSSVTLYRGKRDRTTPPPPY